MNDRLPSKNRYEGNPRLSEFLKTVPVPAHVSEEDREAVLFDADRIGDCVLVSEWWSDEPTPDRLLDVPQMPQAHWEEAIGTYVSLLFSETHPLSPLSEEEKDRIRTRKWDVIQYLKRRRRASELLSRLPDGSRDSVPEHFSAEEYRVFSEELLPVQIEELRGRLNRFLHVPFSACVPETDREKGRSFAQEEALLQHLIHGMETPWEHFPETDASDPEWERGAKAEYSAQFRLFYAHLTAGQRLRYRKHHKEPKAFSGSFSRMELALSGIEELEPEKLEAKGVLLGWHKMTAPACKALADRFRTLTSDRFSNLVVFGSGSVVTVFSDVEAAAVKEAKKCLSAFRRGEDGALLERVEDAWLLRSERITQIGEERIYREALGQGHEDLCKKAASVQLLDRLMQDVYAPQPILFLGSRGFSNVDQKAELIKEQKKIEKIEKKKQQEKEQPQPEATVREDYVSVLRLGGVVCHRIWGEGRLTGMEPHTDDTFWRVDFSGTEKTLSEKWLLANCKT